MSQPRLLLLMIVLALGTFLGCLAPKTIPTPVPADIELNGDESMSNTNEFNFVYAVRDFLSSIGKELPYEHQMIIEKYNPIVAGIIDNSEENEIRILVFKEVWNGSVHSVDPETKIETTNQYQSNFVFVSYECQFQALYNCKLGSNDFPNAQKITFYILEKDLSFCSIELEPVLTQRLLHILQEGPETEPFTCGEFVFYMMSLDYVGLEDPAKVLSLTKLVKWHEPKIGDMLFFSTGGTEFRSIRHWAMYIKDELLLCLFGGNSRLQIASVEQMFAAYETTETYMVIGK